MVAAVVLAIGAAALTVTASFATGGSTEGVSIRDYAYEPVNLRVPVGATITWTNHDGAPHDARAKDGSWTTDMLTRGEKDSITFDTPGDYEYYCTVHPDMIARLTVR